MRKLLVLFSVLCVSLGSAQGSNPDSTILQALSEDADFSTLVGLLEQAGLSEQLSGAGPFTVFAPSNAVFEGLDQAVLDGLVADPALLEQLLLSHVLEGAYSVNDLQDAEAGSLVTLQGEPLKVDTTAGGLRVNGAGFASGNVENEYANGVVQGVNYLVVPASWQAEYGPESALAQAEAAAGAAAGATEETEPADEATAAAEESEQAESGAASDATEADAAMEDSVVSALQDDERFSTLVGLLSQAGLAETLQGEGPFTVFAPTNDAFAALSEEQLSALQADPDMLFRVLSYHVVAGNVMSADVSDGPVMTLEGGDLSASTENGVMFNDATVTEPDLATGNGVVHVIDRVLLPEGLGE